MIFVVVWSQLKESLQVTAETRSILSRRWTTFAVAVFSALLIALSFSSTSRAGLDLGGGDYAYFADDICALTVSPKTGTLNVNGTQTFQFAIVTNPNLPSNLPPIDLPSNQPGVLEESVPVHPTDVVRGCVLQDFSALAGLNVQMRVVSGPGAPATFDALLQPDGTVTFPLVNGGVVGTNDVEFEVVLPKTCLVIEDGLGEPYGYVHIASEIDDCEEELSWFLDDAVPGSTRAHPDARPVPNPTTTLTTTAAVTWIAPPPVAASSAVSVTSFKSCVANRIRIRPSYSSGLRSAKLVVDGKTVQTKTSTSAFILNPSKYKAGKHRFKVVATYDSGTVTSNTGTFSKCKAKVSVKKVKPKFTG